MKDILMAKDIRFDDLASDENNKSFEIVDFESDNISTYDLGITVPKTVNFHCKDVETHPLSNFIDFEDPQHTHEGCINNVVMPEDVVFSEVDEPSARAIIQHVKLESKDYFKGTSFRWVGT